MMPRTRIQVIVVFAVVLVALAFAPIPIKLCPQATIHVVDESGKTKGGVAIYRSWRHFGLRQEDHESRETDEQGIATFAGHTASASAFRRASMLIRLINPNDSIGAWSHFNIYCPSGYEPRLLENGYNLIRKDGDFASYQNRSGDQLLVGYRPPDPKQTNQYSVWVCLDYAGTRHIDFTLPIQRVERVAK